ncbi:MAG: SRPBCC family protein [Thermoanaerobaculia bacterium]|nr:SRPBCC family protein [Thermoanaerobaculia bacterium]
MPTIELNTIVEAPIERVFDLSRSIDLHRASMEANEELVVAGVATGLIEQGESVTWKARHFGFWLSLESRVCQFRRPDHFRDSMVSGPFRRFDHDHHFSRQNGSTLMNDVFDFTTPFALLGQVVDRLVLTAYMTRLLEQRNQVIKAVAESDSWRQYLYGHDT